MRAWPFLAVLALQLHCTATAAPEDLLLRKVIRAYQITPYEPAQRSMGAKERLGQALFFDPFVSGPKSISCATCHVRSLGAADGLPLAVGLGGTGVGKERLASRSALIVPRNALPFFNRGSKAFVALFWDGRLQLGMDGKIESPLGKRLPDGFDSLLAAAAVFPLAEPDEMLGRSLRRSTSKTHHAELVGPEVNSDNFQERTLSVFTNVVRRLLAPGVLVPEQAVARYRVLFQDAYQGTPLTQIQIHHVGNALAAYISLAFELQIAPWDRYVRGDATALTPDQKKGAMIFFGKGRCAVCHSGTEFSDFRFHGLAVPQLRVGRNSHHLDYGRASATGRGQDRFAFRTPPLRNVVLTGPWGHNGYFKSLMEIIEHHGNPVPALYAAQQHDPVEAEHAGRLLSYRSPILAEMAPLAKAELGQILRFLDALSSPTVIADELAIPSDVPSGNREFIRR